MSPNDPYSGGANDQYEGGEQYDDRPNGSVSTSEMAPWGGGWGLGRRDDTSSDATAASDAEVVAEEAEPQRGLYSLLVVVGAVLFVVPEPASSLLGLGLMLAGAVGWLVTR